MTKKKLKILSIIIAFFLSFPLHNLYKLFPSFGTSIFSPVNDSIWEHMKILFGSILIAGIIQKIIVSVKKLKYNNICLSNFIGAILSIPIFLIMYLPLYYLMGENMIISISIMLITIIISEYIAYKLMNKNEFKFEKDTVIFAILTYLIFSILTYFPPKFDLFIDPTTNTYGIQK